MSEARRPLESIGETIAVDAFEVDSIGGAKPEPEERPAYVTTTFDPNTGEQSAAPEQAGAGVMPLILKQAPTVRTELTVDELARQLGKTCRNCANFNHQLGQRLIENEMQNGAPEVVDRWRNTIAEIAMWKPELAGEEFVTDPFAPLPAEREILRMGLCMAMSTPLPDDNTFTHVDLVCPSVEATGHDLFKPKNREVEKTIQAMRDRLLTTAGAVSKPWWKIW
jgi:hypothetical protein